MQADRLLFHQCTLLRIKSTRKALFCEQHTGQHTESTVAFRSHQKLVRFNQHYQITSSELVPLLPCSCSAWKPRQSMAQLTVTLENTPWFSQRWLPVHTNYVFSRHSKRTKPLETLNSCINSNLQSSDVSPCRHVPTERKMPSLSTQRPEQECWTAFRLLKQWFAQSQVFFFF